MIFNFKTWNRLNEDNTIDTTAFTNWMIANGKTDPATAITDYVAALTAKAKTLKPNSITNPTELPELTISAKRKSDAPSTTELINTTFDKAYDYKKDGDTYYYKNKGNTENGITYDGGEWIKADPKRSAAIKSKVTFTAAPAATATTAPAATTATTQTSTAAAKPAATAPAATPAAPAATTPAATATAKTTAPANTAKVETDEEKKARLKGEIKTQRQENRNDRKTGRLENKLDKLKAKNKPNESVVYSFNTYTSLNNK